MFTQTDLTDLIDSAPSVAVSIYLPTQTHGRETRQNPIMLKNLLVQARSRLEQSGLPGSDSDAVLAPAAALVDDYDFWQHQDHGLVLFLSDGTMRSHKLPVPVPEMAVVGPRFHITPLLGLQERGASFVILTMTADATQLWHATRFAIEAMPVEGLPDSIEALDIEEDYEAPVQSHGFGRPNTGGQNMPKTQVYGDSPEEWRKARLVEFTRRAGTAIAARLSGDKLPVVVVADAAMGGHARNDEALSPLVAGFVEVNPATLDPSALHAAAWQVMEPRYRQTRDAALERFDMLAGSAAATACADPDGLVDAAQAGRVDHLFLAEDAALRRPSGQDEASAVDEADAGQVAVDLIERAAQMTLQGGGTVWLVDKARLPEGRSMVATLRY